MGRWNVGDLVDRLADNMVIDPSGCWLWTGVIDQCGYGQIAVNDGRPGSPNRGAHRVSYETLVEPIPDGLVTDHLCRVRRCINPDHLEPVTLRENNLRGTSPSALNAAKTHCKNRHEFTAENTRINADGSRACRECNRQAVARLREQKRADR